MSQIFDKQGKVIPLTLIEAGPCWVLQIKTKEQDGYSSVQLGFIKKTKRIKKTDKGKEFRYIREFRVSPEFIIESKINTGDKFAASLFQEDEKVKVSGLNKGKGFQGGVKRWGFHGRGASHGVKHEERTIGSTGSRFPQRVIKGRKMPGRMGGERVTVKNLKVVKVDPENNLLALKGAVPGRRGTLLEIRG